MKGIFVSIRNRLKYNLKIYILSQRHHLEVNLTMCLYRTACKGSFFQD